ncbi:hypothetical protein [Edaphovirga cremea]|uniref:hypothetical protein n=1 Tax=Edaphovirga cremea TaxID=2267246 RepID=UPI000DEF6DB8|nr:hypothetical protein [Edaphovirga cremea]
MKLRLLFSCIAMIGLSGCNSDTPKCNSDEAKNLVVDIARKPYIAASKREPDYDMPSIIVNNVRTQQYNAKLDIYLCEADISFTYKKYTELNSSRPITYRIQKTDDNNGQFYINVFGL